MDEKEARETLLPSVPAHTEPTLTVKISIPPSVPAHTEPTKQEQRRARLASVPAHTEPTVGGIPTPDWRAQRPRAHGADSYQLWSSVLKNTSSCVVSHPEICLPVGQALGRAGDPFQQLHFQVQFQFRWLKILDCYATLLGLVVQIELEIEPLPRSPTHLFGRTEYNNFAAFPSLCRGQNF
jgi:hypothetical protein